LPVEGGQAASAPNGQPEPRAAEGEKLAVTRKSKIRKSQQGDSLVEKVRDLQKLRPVSRGRLAPPGEEEKIDFKGGQRKSLTVELLSKNERES